MPALRGLAGGKQLASRFRSSSREVGRLKYIKGALTMEDRRMLLHAVLKEIEVHFINLKYHHVCRFLIHTAVLTNSTLEWLKEMIVPQS